MFKFFEINKLSHSLFYHERPESFTHGRSFVMSDLINSLTAAHLS